MREILKENSKLDFYLNALIKEIEMKKVYLENHKINSIFFGGGTPSILSASQIYKLGDKLNSSFNLEELKEFSFEMNAKTITEEKAKALLEIGVTHVRVGVQTFNIKYRKIFEISATIDDINNGVIILKKYFKNVSIDLLYGFNGETIGDFLYDLKKATELDVPNISLYPLNNKSVQNRLIEEYKNHGLEPFSGLDRFGFKIVAKEYMIKNGYLPHNGHDFVKTTQKDIKNFFITEQYKFEYHKTVYGKEKSVLVGFGASALSFFNGYITMNESKIDTYINEILEEGKHNMTICSYDRTLDQMRPIILYLPYHGKIKKTEFMPIVEKFPLLKSKIDELVSNSLLEYNNDEIRLTELGWLSYVNILYFLSPELDQKLLIENIENCEKKRNIGAWNFKLD